MPRCADASAALLLDTSGILSLHNRDIAVDMSNSHNTLGILHDPGLLATSRHVGRLLCESEGRFSQRKWKKWNAPAVFWLLQIPFATLFFGQIVSVLLLASLPVLASAPLPLLVPFSSVAPATVSSVLPFFLSLLSLLSLSLASAGIPSSISYAGYSVSSLHPLNLQHQSQPSMFSLRFLWSSAALCSHPVATPSCLFQSFSPA